MPTRKKPMIIVHSFEDIPSFTAEQEDEEREWWATHELSEELYDQLQDLTADFNARHPLEPKEPRKRAAS